MSLASLFNFLWAHKPTDQQIVAVKELAQAAESFIALLQAKLPDIEGKTEAIDAAKSALIHGNLVLAKAAQDEAIKPPPPAESSL